MATGCTSNVQECEDVWQEGHRVLCAKCAKVEGQRQLMSFTLIMSREDVFVGQFAYLGDMLNDTGRVKQTVVTRVREAEMKSRQLGGILCT